ncbi:synaptonemal complex central element protein 1-like [Heterocephalus glaber]|uniref:Synaptonemal complex central element protein 1-like n=1 Tax=Heterocephalus glaber TaxID=10181 RepID=A0AAX6SRJ7_HETGA|nr:synaptonemal complex central element protein 1-like [Heterocephalus glaber]
MLPAAPCGPLASVHTEAPQGRSPSLQALTPSRASGFLSPQRQALMILRQHSQGAESEAARLDEDEQLEDLVAQHKDVWEFHVLELRLTREIRALQRSQEQLRAEGTLVRARLQEVERRLRLAAEVGGDPVVTD